MGNDLFLQAMLLTFAWVPFAIGGWLLDDMTAEPVRRWFAHLVHPAARPHHHGLTHAH